MHVAKKKNKRKASHPNLLASTRGRARVARCIAYRDGAVLTGDCELVRCAVPGTGEGSVHARSERVRAEVPAGLDVEHPRLRIGCVHVGVSYALCEMCVADTTPPALRKHERREHVGIKDVPAA